MYWDIFQPRTKNKNKVTENNVYIMLSYSWKMPLIWLWKILTKILQKVPKLWNFPHYLALSKANTSNPTNFLRPLLDSQCFLSLNFYYIHNTHHRYVSTHVALDHQTYSAIAQHTQIRWTAQLKCDWYYRVEWWRLGLHHIIF